MGVVPAPNRWIVTAKFTDDGAVAWRATGGAWSRRLDDSELFPDEASAAAVASRAGVEEQREVSDPYVIGVFADGATIDPLTARERIRATGPTVRPPR